MHQRESTGALWWTISRTHTTRQGLCMFDRGRTLLSSLMLDFQIIFSSKFMQDQAMPIRRRTSPLLPPEESIMLPR